MRLLGEKAWDLPTLPVSKQGGSSLVRGNVPNIPNLINSSTTWCGPFELDGAIVINFLHSLWLSVTWLTVLSVRVFSDHSFVSYLVDMFNASSIFFLIVL